MSDTNQISLQVGDIAPDFTLYSLRGEKTNLYQLLDSDKMVLLVFYPKDMTPGCTGQLCGIRDVYKEYQDLGVAVFGVNQGSAESHIRFTDTYSFPFELLIDEDRKVAQQYSAIKSIFGNVGTKRGVFLIDTNKTIVYHVWGQQKNEDVIDFIKNAK